MPKYFILIDHTGYVAKNQLAKALQEQFLKLNKSVTTDLKRTILRFENISKTAHNLNPRCKEIPFEKFSKYHKLIDLELNDTEEHIENDFWIGHHGVAIAKFYKIREEALNV